MQGGDKVQGGVQGLGCSHRALVPVLVLDPPKLVHCRGAPFPAVPQDPMAVLLGAPDCRGRGWGQPRQQPRHGGHPCCGLMVAVFPKGWANECTEICISFGYRSRVRSWAASRMGCPGTTSCLGPVALGGSEMGTCHPQTRHFGRQQRPHTPCAINKYVSLDVCCYVPIPEWLGPLGSEQLLSAGKRKGSKWCGNAWQIGMQYTAGLSLLRDPQPGQGGGGE